MRSFRERMTGLPFQGFSLSISPRAPAATNISGVKFGMKASTPSGLKTASARTSGAVFLTMLKNSALWIIRWGYISKRLARPRVQKYNRTIMKDPLVRLTMIYIKTNGCFIKSLWIKNPLLTWRNSTNMASSPRRKSHRSNISSTPCSEGTSRAARQSKPERSMSRSQIIRFRRPLPIS